MIKQTAIGVGVAASVAGGVATYVNTPAERLPVTRTVVEQPIKSVPCEIDCSARLRMTFGDQHIERIPTRDFATCLQMAIDITEVHNKSRVGKNLKPRSVLIATTCEEKS